MYQIVKENMEKRNEIRNWISGKREIHGWHLCLIYSLLVGIYCLFFYHHAQLLRSDAGVRGSDGLCSCSQPQEKQHESIIIDKEQVEVNHGEEEVDDDLLSVQSKNLKTDDNRTQSDDDGMSLRRTEPTQGGLLNALAHELQKAAIKRDDSIRTEPEHSDRVRRSVEGSGLPEPERIFVVDNENTTSAQSPVPSTESFQSENLNETDDLRPVTRVVRQAEERGNKIRNRKLTTTTPRPTGKKSGRNQSQKKKAKKGNVVIHLHAPENMERQYESGPIIPFNTSITKDTVYRFWKKADWVESDVEQVFHLDEKSGHVTVEEEGLYMIYAQVVYHDLSGRWSYGIYVGDQERVKCLATEQLKDLHSYHSTSHGVYQSCYTSIVLRIRKNQSITIRCLYGSRTILTRPEFTFWGIIRLG